MRQSREAKARSHEVIVAEAGRLFRERGLERTSVADVMEAAAMTHGGFYRHFDSKDALAAAALRAAFDAFAGMIAESAAARGAPDAVGEYFDLYLSDPHVRNPGLGCPIATLGPDVARGGEDLRAAFRAGLSAVVGQLAQGLEGSPQQRQDEALKRLAQAAGAVVIARAAGEPMARRVLAACAETSPKPTA
jgi:TetR/AcrR family transcriptional repressor of nem operon